MTSKVHLAVCLMVKNEEMSLPNTLESIKNYVSSIVMYDTGSTDNTLSIAQHFCDENCISLRLITSSFFTDFSTERNKLLEFADTFQDIDLILLMDSNDELKGGDEFVSTTIPWIMSTHTTGFLIGQQWLTPSTVDKYFNTRVIKPRCGWRYIGCVHEYIDHPLARTEMGVQKFLPDTVYLYQDRHEDSKKSMKRHDRDLELLLDAYNKNTADPRTVFYLAQTYSCIPDKEQETYYYYKKRAMMGGEYTEEIFHSYMRMGDMACMLGHDWENRMKWYMKAFETEKRAEPLGKIAYYYIGKEDYLMAYYFLKIASDLEFPSKAILFVDKNMYDYVRWHFYSISLFQIGKVDEAFQVVEKMKKDGVVKDVDLQNQMKFIESRVTSK